MGKRAELLRWLQGSAAGKREARVLAPEPEAHAEDVNHGPFRKSSGITAGDVDVQLDYVGSVQNAAKVIASLHRGEKRLVFCDSKRLVEQLGTELRDRGVTTYLSHASLALDERRRAEQAFAEGAGLRHRVDLHARTRS
jgi:ATP-dependent Lhr-like helicase